MHYLDDGERGLLNFVASTTRIRNRRIVEEAFGVQQDSFDFEAIGKNKKIVGHQVSLQVSGFRWIPVVQVSGVQVFPLHHTHTFHAHTTHDPDQPHHTTPATHIKHHTHTHTKFVTVVL